MPLEVLVLGPVPLFRPCRGHDGSGLAVMFICLKPTNNPACAIIVLLRYLRLIVLLKDRVYIYTYIEEQIEKDNNEEEEEDEEQENNEENLIGQT